MRSSRGLLETVEQGWLSTGWTRLSRDWLETIELGWLLTGWRRLSSTGSQLAGRRSSRDWLETVERRLDEQIKTHTHNEKLL
jgi:hypothetical protein